MHGQTTLKSKHVFISDADYSQHSFRVRVWAYKPSLSPLNYMLFHFKYFTFKLVAIFPATKRHIFTCVVISSNHFFTHTDTVLLLIETRPIFSVVTDSAVTKRIRKRLCFFSHAKSVQNSCTPASKLSTYHVDKADAETSHTEDATKKKKHKQAHNLACFKGSTKLLRPYINRLYRNKNIYVTSLFFTTSSTLTIPLAHSHVPHFPSPHAKTEIQSMHLLL